ncbi:scavenger receptor cysteine-rich domain-containing protein DMBT1-like, partial [Polymixia lowei]
MCVGFILRNSETYWVADMEKLNIAGIIIYITMAGATMVTGPSESASVRLVNGTGPCSGRVEVYHRGQWGTVCDNSWDIIDAKVVCRQLGCGKALDVKYRAYFGEGSGDILMSGVTCSGSEETLLQCNHKRVGSIKCGHDEDAGVVCSGRVDVRVAAGFGRCSGRVEVYRDDQWGTVCATDGYYWTAMMTGMFCEELGCGKAVKYKPMAFFGESSGKIAVTDVWCYGEDYFSDCLESSRKRHCDHTHEAGVLCSDLRLVNGTSHCSGRVEVCYDGQWGTVCGENWDLNDAEVTCRQMNCGRALSAKNSSYFGEGSGPIWMSGVQCSGLEESLTRCLHSDSAAHSCGHDDEAGVICSDNIDVKLVKGTGRCSGVVETSYRGQRGRVCYGKYEWQGSVCGWRIYDAAKTVCKQLECGPPISVFRSNASPMELQRLRSLEIDCLAKHSNLKQCQLLGFDCSSYDYLVGIRCTAAVRLVDGPDRCSGRVEVNHDGQWGTVCDDEWDLNDAEVVCREMGCGSALSAKRRAYFGPGIREIWMNKLRCSGEEESFKRCPHSGFGRHDCGHHQDAGVVCSGAVRLANGTDHCSGRLEVYRHGQWGTVCDEDWDMRDARVVCRELGCGKAVDVKTKAFFGEGSGEVSMSRVKCGGREESVAHCSHSRPGSETCGHQQDAGVVCSASLTESVKVRLANGPDGCMGTVEVYRNGQWGTVCGVDWGLREADVVCRQMGCGMALEVKHSAFFGEGSGGILMSNVKCSGSEDYLSQCTHNPLGMQRCGHSDDVGVVCAERVKARLVNGRADGCSGRVEVFYRGQWGTVAGFDWGMEDAEVVCREIGCGKAEKRTLWGNSGSGSGEVWMSSVACSGQELLLTQCPHKGWGEEDRHGFDVSVTCLGPVRLVGWFDPCAGRVEVYRHSQWGTVCDDDWDMKEAEVVCRQLNCGTALYVKHRAEFGEGSGEIWMSGVQCSGLEESLTHCRHKSPGHHSCGHERDAGLVCSKSVQVRLTNGTDGCSGRVEVYYNGQWGRVDSAGWDMNEAMVVCRELDCGKAKDA